MSPATLADRLPDEDANSQLTNVTLHDTSYDIQYLPFTDREGREVRTPWAKYYYLPFTRSKDTFHHTSSWGNEEAGFGNRQIAFKFKGTTLYIYGAPKAELEQLSKARGQTYIHARSEICINVDCYPMDNDKSYSDVSEKAKHLPVLLWSRGGFPPTQTTQVHIRLLDTKSQPGPERGLSFERAVYTTLRSSGPKLPTIDGDEKTESVSCTEFDYEGEITWTEGKAHIGKYKWADNSVKSSLPKWTYQARGHKIAVFGPPLEVFQNVSIAAARICVDQECHILDVEHIYLGVAFEDEQEAVLLHSFEHLDPRNEHEVSMEMVDNIHDHSRRAVAVSHLEYSQTSDSFDGVTIQRSMQFFALFVIVALLCKRSSAKSKEPIPAAAQPAPQPLRYNKFTAGRPPSYRA